MSLCRAAWASAFVLLALLWNQPVSAQDLMLPKDSEAGFLRFMQMAQTGQLGDDVINANVGVFKTWVQVELVRQGAPKKLLYLKPKSTTQAFSRYFDIEAGEGTTASDVVRVGRALDAVFADDPFELTLDLFNTTPDRIPRLADAWAYGGWRGVFRALQRRMVAMAGLTYTVAVIATLVAGLLVTLVLLWGSMPPRSTADS